MSRDLCVMLCAIVETKNVEQDVEDNILIHTYINSFCVLPNINCSLVHKIQSTHTTTTFMLTKNLQFDAENMRAGALHNFPSKN